MTNSSTKNLNKVSPISLLNSEFSKLLQKATDENKSEIIKSFFENDENRQLEISLSDASTKDNIWDSKRSDTQETSLLYYQSSDTTQHRLAERADECSTFLQFGIRKSGLKLKTASFCRVRYCPTCLWRKSLLYQYRMFQVLEPLADEYQFLFLTLTTKNPHITCLRDELKAMNKAWNKFVKRKNFQNAVVGWVRTTEVTKGKDNPNNANPHFHAILVVRKSYFTSRDYIKQSDFAEMWRTCLMVDYTPQVDVKKVRKRKNQDYKTGLMSAVFETFKYSVKSTDWLDNTSDKQGREWFYELTRQTHKLRFFATGGLLKDKLKEDVDNENLINIDTEEDENAEIIGLATFTWRKARKQYISAFPKI